MGEEFEGGPGGVILEVGGGMGTEGFRGDVVAISFYEYLPINELWI